MWTSHRARPMALGLRLEVGERHAEVLAVAVDEHDLALGSLDGERRCHERVGGAEDRLSGHPGVVERGERPTGPARERDRRGLVPGRPRRLEPACHLSIRPSLGVDDLVPQLVQPRAVSKVEADGELREAGGSIQHPCDATSESSGARGQKTHDAAWRTRSRRQRSWGRRPGYSPTPIASTGRERSARRVGSARASSASSAETPRIAASWSSGT